MYDRNITFTGVIYMCMPMFTHKMKLNYYGQLDEQSRNVSSFHFPHLSLHLYIGYLFEYMVQKHFFDCSLCKESLLYLGPVVKINTGAFISVCGYSQTWVSPDGGS